MRMNRLFERLLAALLLALALAYEVPASAQVTPVLLGTLSRKVHGAAGTFDLPLGSVASNPTTEPRLGPIHTIVFRFDGVVTAGTASVVEGTATAGAPTFSGNEMIVPLTAASGAQYVSIAVSNVSTAGGGTGGSGSTRIGFLAADVNQNRVVTVADMGLVNAQLAQPVTASNYLKDVNASGTLTVADKGVTNANLTRALPDPATLAGQSITFNSLANRTLGTAPFTISATASSGLPVTFTSLTSAVCSVSGSTVTLISAGTCTIQASQAGNANYSAAPNVSQSFGVTEQSQTLTITTPSPNTSIAADFVMVSGTYQAPPNSGVTVNGTVAGNDGQGNYFVNNLPLVDGASTLTVTLTTQEGQTTTQTRTITRTALAPMQIYANPEADFAPATYTIRVANRTTNTITHISYANLGGGQLDTSNLDQATLGRITYTSPGVYVPRFVITDSGGGTYTQTVTILVQDKTALDQMLKSLVWGGFITALANGPKALALQNLNVGRKASFGPVYDALAGHWGEIVTTFSPIGLMELDQEAGEYAVTRMTNGSKHIYFITIVRDTDGVWRLDSF
jgi:hypothetical protein